MNIAGALIAGLVGTVIMAVVVYLVSILPVFRLVSVDLFGLVGSMFTPDQRVARALGILFHLWLGVIFALIYALLWALGAGSPTWVWGALFGGVHGLLATGLVLMMLQMHPQSPSTQGGALVGNMVLAHFAYGITVAWIYSHL